MKKKEKTKKPQVNKLALLPEPFANASKERPLCGECGFWKRAKNLFVKPYVPKGYTGRLLLVLPRPEGENVALSRKGRLLRRLWEKAGYKSADVAIAFASICDGSRSHDATMRQLRCCRPFLLRTIHVLKPRTILGLGSTVLHSLTDTGTGSVTDSRGRTLVVPGLQEGDSASDKEETGTGGDRTHYLPTVWVTFDPQAVLDGAVHFESLILEDFKRHSLPVLRHPVLGVDTTAMSQGVDTEYAADGSLLTLSVATKGGSLAVEPVEKGSKNYFSVAQAITNARWICGHSIMGDVDHLVRLRLAKEEWVRGRKLVDTLLMARMADENKVKGSYSLENLLTSHFQVKPWKKETEKIIKKEGDARAWSQEQREERCRLDAWATSWLAHHYTKKGLTKLDVFTHEIAATLHRTKLAGAYIDMKKFHELGKKWHRDAEQAFDLVKKAALGQGMQDFEPTNDGHLRTLLYEKLGLPVISRTEVTKEPQVSKPTFKALKRTHPDCHVLDHLMAFNTADKLASTWYGSSRSDRPSLRDIIKETSRPDIGRLENEINPLGARTGRRSSGGGREEALYEATSRNSQNWPEAARVVVVSRWPGGKILSVDYKRLEVVLCAWVARDKKLLDYFTHGEGYEGIGKELFAIEVVNGSQEYKIIKSIVLGTQYNMKEWKLATDLKDKLGITFADDWDRHLEETAKIRRHYLLMFPDLALFIGRQKRTLEKYGMVKSPSNRIRHLPHHGRNTPKYWHLENQAVNFPIQSFASDVTGSAAVDCEWALIAASHVPHLEWHRMLLEDPMNLPSSVLINEVHDELVFDLHPNHIERDKKIVLDTMRAVPSLRKLVPEFTIPVNLDVVLADHWGAEA